MSKLSDATGVDVNIGDTLFGSSQDAKQTGSADVMTPEQKKYLQQLIGILSEQTGEGVPQYQGQLTPGESGIQSSVFNELQGLLSGGYNRGAATTDDVISRTMGGSQNVPGAVPVQQAQSQNIVAPGAVDVMRADTGAFDSSTIPGAVPVQAASPGSLDLSTIGRASPQTFDPGSFQNWWESNVSGDFPDAQAIQDYWSSTVKDPALQVWKEEVLPSIQESFISQNAGSSGASNRAIAKSGEDLLSGLSSDLSQRIFDAQNQSAQRGFESGTNLGNILFGASQSDIDRGLTSESDFLNRLFQAGQTQQGREFSSSSDFVTRLQNALESGAGRQYSAGEAQKDRDLTSALDYVSRLQGAGENAATRQMAADESNAARSFASSTDFVNNLLRSGENAATRGFTAGQSDLDRILNLPGIASQSDASAINNLMNILNAGSVQRGIAGEGMQSDYNQWIASQPYNNPWLNIVPTALGSTAFTPIVQGPVQTEGLWQTMMSNAGNLASLGSMASSLRHKKNVTSIGKIGGLDVIEFEYTDKALKENPETTMPGQMVGFIAEQVAGIHPETVSYDSEGRPNAIKYGMLLEKIKGSA